MASFYFLIPIAIAFCALATAAFFWAVDRGQFDDLDSEGQRILFEDETLLDPTIAHPQAHHAPKP
jgi:cbb3-type cytochrome oxidase maturation protein